MGNAGSFKKGDPRISAYKKGDGRKRKPFVKGYDPRRNKRLQEVNFQPGNVEASKRKGPKVHARNDKVHLIPQEFQVAVLPSETGMELVKLLDDTIAFARQMQEMISRSTNVNNAKAVGRYTELINKCLDTSAQIKGGQMTPAKYGDLGKEDTEKLKAELARVLAANMTKMQHSVHYAREEMEENEEGVYYPRIFGKSGVIKTWASDGFCYLISGTRKTVETRARLDAWERRSNEVKDPMIEAFRGLKRG